MPPFAQSCLQPKSRTSRGLPAHKLSPTLPVCVRDDTSTAESTHSSLLGGSQGEATSSQPHLSEGGGSGEKEGLLLEEADSTQGVLVNGHAGKASLAPYVEGEVSPLSQGEDQPLCPSPPRLKPRSPPELLLGEGAGEVELLPALKYTFSDGSESSCCICLLETPLNTNGGSEGRRVWGLSKQLTDALATWNR